MTDYDYPVLMKEAATALMGLRDSNLKMFSEQTYELIKGLREAADSPFLQAVMRVEEVLEPVEEKRMFRRSFRYAMKREGEEAIMALRECRALGVGDMEVEDAHHRADVVLCKLLRTVGFGDVVDEWSKVPKWYA